MLAVNCSYFQNYLRELGIRCACLIDAKVPGLGDSLLMAFGIRNYIFNSIGLMAMRSRCQENKIAVVT
ncbi:MAG: hypothetical protein KPI85_01595 [cyanobacterium endosymbiont of Epithemia adnata isolate EadnSB Bon19]